MTKNDASSLALHRARPRDLFPVAHRLTVCANGVAAGAVTWIVRPLEKTVSGCQTKLVALIQAGGVILGGRFGRFIHYPGWPPTVYTKVAIAAVLIVIAGALVSLATRRADDQPTFREWVWGISGE